MDVVGPASTAGSAHGSAWCTPVGCRGGTAKPQGELSLSGFDARGAWVPPGQELPASGRTRAAQDDVEASRAAYGAYSQCFSGRSISSTQEAPRRLPPLPLVRALHISDDANLDVLCETLFGTAANEQIESSGAMVC